ncbi:MAG: hypothetical protein Q8N99_06250 [Nanoarchaeota archaeon]|nr:hypothetical protein [Nanoarchaeota archaeon]
MEKRCINYLFIMIFSILLINLTSVQAAVKCSETDKALDFYTPGTCIGFEGEKNDTCYGNTLIEYYCGVSGGACYSMNYNCIYGCVDGACKKSKDSKPIANQGNNTNNNVTNTTIPVNQTVTCENECNSVGEKKCNGNKKQACYSDNEGCLKWNESNCPNGCSDGNCIIVNNPDDTKSNLYTLYIVLAVFVLIIVVIIFVFLLIKRMKK